MQKILSKKCIVIIYFYRLSKNRMLTKGQREAVSDFLVALTSQLQPAMLLKLLRKLTVDVSKLSEYTTVALRVNIKNIRYIENILLDIYT